MKRGYKLVAAIILLLILFLCALLLLKPYVIEKYEEQFNKEKIKEVPKVEEDEPLTDEHGVVVTTITLGLNVLIEGDGASFNESESNLYITAGGVYEVSGSLVSGAIIIDTIDDVKLKLYGINLENSSGPVLISKQNGTLILESMEGMTNTLNSGGTTTLSSVGNLVFSGKGIININNYNQALQIDGGYKIESGTVIMASNEIVNPLDGSTQKYILNSFDSVVNQNEIVYLLKDNEIVMEFTNKTSARSLLISSPLITEGNYVIEKSVDGQSRELMKADIVVN